MRAPRNVEPEEEDRRLFRSSRGGSGAFPLYSEQEIVRVRAVNGPPGNFQYDSTSPGPAVGEKREEELPPSSQQRPVVVKCLVKTECSSRSAGSSTTSVREYVRRRSSTTFASVRECLVPCHSMRSPKNHRRSISIDAGRNYRIIFNFNFNLS